MPHISTERPSSRLPNPLGSLNSTVLTCSLSLLHFVARLNDPALSPMEADLIVLLPYCSQTLVQPLTSLTIFLPSDGLNIVNPLFRILVCYLYLLLYPLYKSNYIAITINFTSQVYSPCGTTESSI